MITVIINDKPFSLPTDATLEKCLQAMNIKKKAVAVAVNNRIVRKEDYGSTVLEEGDKLLIVQPVGGG